MEKELKRVKFTNLGGECSETELGFLFLGLTCYITVSFTGCGCIQNLSVRIVTKFESIKQPYLYSSVSAFG